jgi:hypothetical protein
LIVLDAKYRIEQGLNDALSSIHAYRDALVREVDSGNVEGIVSAAYLLAPMCRSWLLDTVKHRSPVGCFIRSIELSFASEQ